jgi:hypothetical protein
MAALRSLKLDSSRPCIRENRAGPLPVLPLPSLRLREYLRGMVQEAEEVVIPVPVTPPGTSGST